MKRLIVLSILLASSCTPSRQPGAMQDIQIGMKTSRDVRDALLEIAEFETVQNTNDAVQLHTKLGVLRKLTVQGERADELLRSGLTYIASEKGAYNIYRDDLRNARLQVESESRP